MESDEKLPVIYPVEPEDAGDGSGRRLDLKVGFTCNNRCTFCVQGDKRNEIPPRTTDECKALLLQHRATTDSVVFTGGEASVRNDLVELVGYARELGYRTIQLQTNGRRMAYMPFARAMLGAGLTEVSPALHGSTAELHDELTRAKGAFSQCVQGIINARQLGLPVITNSVVVRRNFADLPALARLLIRLDVQQIQFAYVHPAGTAEQNFLEVVPRFSEAVPHIQAALALVRAAGIRGYTEAVPYCFMAGFEEFVVEQHIPRTTVVDRPMVIEDYTAYRWAEGKAKGPPCVQCTYAGLCEGPWHEYPREYGWDEFVPRADAPPAS